MDWFLSNNRRSWVVPIALILMGGGCSKPKLNLDAYPMFLTRHETVELPFSQVVEWRKGEGYDFELTPGVLPNGHQAVVVNATGEGRYFLATYDRETREWTVPLFFANEYSVKYLNRPSDSIIKDKGITITDPDQYSQAREKIEKVICLKNDAYKRGQYYGYDSGYEWLYEKSESNHLKGKKFTYDISGKELIGEESAVGGFLGWERRSKHRVKDFFGLFTVYYDNKSIIKSYDKRFFERLTLTDNFKTVIYRHVSLDSIKFTLIDLRELDQAPPEKAKPDAPQNPVQSADPR